MERNVDLFKKLKSLGWNNKVAWEGINAGQKPLSPGRIMSQLQEPVDWVKVAENCAANPKHELYGNTGAEIQAIWKSRGTAGKNRGNSLDDYITAKLQGAYFNLDTIDDDALKAKCTHFDQLYDNVLTKFNSYIGSEIWMNSKNLGIICRLDSAFLLREGDILVAEWKNTEKLETSNRYKKLLGPAGLLDDCDFTKFTIQTHFYRYILEEYGIFNNVATRIFQFNIEKCTTHKEAFTYDPKFIEEIVKYSKAKVQEGALV